MSAGNIYAALDATRYQVTLIGITKEGQWLLDPDAKAIGSSAIESKGLIPVALSHDGRNTLVAQNYSEQSVQQLGKLDLIFPVLHGPFGEDGTVQGLLELAGVAYVGSGVAGSAVGMDKAVANSVFKSEGIPQAPFQVCRAGEWEANPEAILKALTSELRYPVFVKPANLGSSVGICKASDEESLRDAIDVALRHDIKLVVEQGIEDCHEIEVAVLGNEQPKASQAGEIVPGGEFYDYHDKYHNGLARTIIPAPISESATAKVRDYAVRAFKAIDAAGLARVDFFVGRASDDVYINEINTMPGFTDISMYPKLWEASGIGYAELIDRLVELALERRKCKDRLQTTF